MKTGNFYDQYGAYELSTNTNENETWPISLRWGFDVASIASMLILFRFPTIFFRQLYPVSDGRSLNLCSEMIAEAEQHSFIRLFEIGNFERFKTFWVLWFYYSSCKKCALKHVCDIFNNHGKSTDFCQEMTINKRPIRSQIVVPVIHIRDRSF